MGSDASLHDTIPAPVSRSPRIHDIWNPALIAALDERATA